MMQNERKDINNIDENDIEDFTDFEDYYKISSKDVDENNDIRELDFN